MDNNIDNNENNVEKTIENTNSNNNIDMKKEIIEWIVCIIIALIIALAFRYYIGTPTVVKHKSMFPTLKENQRLILDRTMRITGKTPERGDIITFESPTHAYTKETMDQSNPVAIYNRTINGVLENFAQYVVEFPKTSYIKRVIGVAGDHVVITGGKIYLNDKVLEEDYLDDDVVTNSPAFDDFIVPEGYVFAIGDNRGNSIDCRSFGCIPLEKVEGIVAFRFWPFNQFGKVN